MFKKRVDLQLIIALGLVFTATVIIIICAVSCSGGTITFKETYYFICYRQSDNAVSASSLSDTAENLGGAGYVLEYDDNFYVTLSCYYKENEAEDVCSNLKKREIDCFVLNIETDEYKLGSKKNKELFSGNLYTLNSLSRLAYDCANGLDTGKYSQNQAKNVLANIKETLNGLLKSNGDNCFTERLKSAIDECGKFGGFLYSKNMRYVQIALADIIINAELN